ncbi:MAG: 3-deoxy-manno-octulosonate cytidylyltransferase [Sphingobacteriaceae bacterium]|nr:3-deoxy-manno-octulosonate cytidylyltransferase [Sphingobacteriaceae bacterium]
MKCIALLPARLASTRLPEKMLADLAGKPLIVRSYEAVAATNLFDEVWIVTDHERIFTASEAHGAKVCMSSPSHSSGSDRLAEVARQRPDVALIVNVQGDEPFTQKNSLEALMQCFNDSAVQVASLCCPIASTADFNNPNLVKVVKDQKGDALYFSRAPIPYLRDGAPSHQLPFAAWQHIGIYGYKRDILLQFTQWAPSPLEEIEKLEQLRLLHHGINIRMAEVHEKSIGIDTAEDLENARRWFSDRARS